MGTSRDGSQRVTLEATFSLTVKVNKGISIKELLEKHTEWFGEPTNSDGFIMAMNFKDAQIVKNGSKELIE